MEERGREKSGRERERNGREREREKSLGEGKRQIIGETDKGGRGVLGRKERGMEKEVYGGIHLHAFLKI